MDNVKYNIGDKIDDFSDYVDNCMALEHLSNRLKIGDKVITYNNISEGNVVVEYKFTGWKQCGHKISNGGCSCKQCKGYMGVLDHKNIELSLCIGSSEHSDKSLVLKITKNIEMNSIKDYEFKL